MAKRVNLSFDEDREDDMKVYAILVEQKLKTDFVIKVILEYMKNEGNFVITRESIKMAVKEAIQESGGLQVDSRIAVIEKGPEELPKEIFDMFNDL